MQNLDYWNTFVGEESPEAFMRNYGSTDPELCVTRFLEERGQLYGVVNQGSWVKTFAMSEQHHCLTVKVYLLSYLEDTRDVWLPLLEATPPAPPRRYREKFDQDRFPPPGAVVEESPADEVGTYGSYVPESDHDFSEVTREALSEGIPADTAIEDSGASFEEIESESTPAADGDTSALEETSEPAMPDVVIPETDVLADELLPER